MWSSHSAICGRTKGVNLAIPFKIRIIMLCMILCLYVTTVSNPTKFIRVNGAPWNTPSISTSFCLISVEMFSQLTVNTTSEGNKFNPLSLREHYKYTDSLNVSEKFNFF